MPRSGLSEPGLKRTLEPDDNWIADIGESESGPLRRRPPQQALRWVVDSVGTGARIQSVRRLTEGHWHANHLVTVRDPMGQDRDLVLRRWARANWRAKDPTLTPEREATTLELLSPVAIGTPTLVNVDADASYCDVPAILTDRLPGLPPATPENMDSFVRQLAEALPLIHGVNAEQAATRLPRYERYFNNDDAGVPPTWAHNRQIWQRAKQIAAGEAPPGHDCLIHRDYHPGNTLWVDGRLSGVVDWTQGSWGRAAVDTAHMRWNLAVAMGIDAADRFLEYYRLVCSDTEEDQGYWDVITLLDLIPDINPSVLPPNWNLFRLEPYLESVLQRMK